MHFFDKIIQEISTSARKKVIFSADLCVQFSRPRHERFRFPFAVAPRKITADLGRDIEFARSSRQVVVSKLFYIIYGSTAPPAPDSRYRK